MVLAFVHQAQILIVASESECVFQIKLLTDNRGGDGELEAITNQKEVCMKPQLKYLKVKILLLSTLMTSCGYSKQAFETLENSQQISLHLSDDWESTGGEGVLCTESVRDGIELEVLEFYEDFSSENYTVWEPLKEYDSYEQILSAVVGRVNNYSPVFAQKLQQSLSQISLNEWIEDENSKRVTAIRTRVELPENCSLIQLAYRKQHANSRHHPEVIIYFTESYFNHMSPINQAMLIVHESLYLIGKESTQTDSNQLRALNSLIFSQNLESDYLTERYFSQNARVFQMILSRTFGDYLDFFIEDNFYNELELHENTLQGNNYTRSFSMSVLNRELNSAVNSCRHEGYDIQTCQDKVLLSDHLNDIVNTNEKAFLFLLNYFFDRYGILTASAENFYWINPDHPIKHDHNIQQSLVDVCGQMEEFVARNMGKKDLIRFTNGLTVLSSAHELEISQAFENHIWLEKFTIPALRYCKEVGIKIGLPNS